ncbi:hypothetical protein JCM11641_007925 [Rhodosporidiobolus odoratus]
MPPRLQPGNPQWVEWVQQLVDKADERGEKAVQSYKKAANSLRCCPIPFTHPDEALQLTGVGPKVVAHLTKRLKEQCEHDGTEMPDRAPSPSKPRSNAKAAPNPPKPKPKFAPVGPSRKRAQAETDQAPEDDPRYTRRLKAMGVDLPAAAESGAVASGSGIGAAGAVGRAAVGGGLGFQVHPDGHAWNEEDDEEEEDEDDEGDQGGKGKGKAKAKPKSKPNKSGEKKERTYIPRQSSGSYAILLALYLCCTFEKRESWTTKQRIMDVGSEYSTAPFETGTAMRGGQVQGGGAFSYSAWNGMKTLTGKNLVTTDNRRPAKYALTPSGYSLAEKLAPAAGVGLHKPAPPTSSSSAAHPSSSGMRGAGGGGGGHPSSGGGGGVGDLFSGLDNLRSGGAGSGGPGGGVVGGKRPRPPPMIIGGPGSGIRPPDGIHAATLGMGGRRREVTPDFLKIPAAQAGEESQGRGGEGGGADGGHRDEEAEFQAQLRQAMRESLSLSQQAMSSSSPSSSSAPSRRAGARDLDPAAVARRAAGEAALARHGQSVEGVDAAIGGGGVGTAMDGRKAASGMYAAAKNKHAREVEENVGGVMNVDSAFGYYYLTENDARTPHRHLAEVSQIPTPPFETLYRIEYRLAQDLHAMVRGLVRPSSSVFVRPPGKELPGGKTKTAYMRERVGAVRAPGFPGVAMGGGGGGGRKGEASGRGHGEKEKERLDPVKRLLAGFREPSRKRRAEEMYEAPKEDRRLGAEQTVVDEMAAAIPAGGGVDEAASASEARKSRPSQMTLNSASSSSALPVASKPTSRSTSTSAATAPARSSANTTSAARPPSSAHPFPRSTSTTAPLYTSFDAPLPASSSTHNGLIINRHPLDPVTSHLIPSTYVPPSFTPTIWPAHSFKVILIVDSREGTREAGKRVELCDKMEQLGVRTERRMLVLGDMVWVARRWDWDKDRPMDKGEGGDVVLDAIVERKRLDDLCSSIIDGRYVGQKFRYKDSGISNRIYLIEKYDTAAQYEKFGKQIWTCKSQLQVNDGFFVHESANIADTINWLKNRTKVMAEEYEGSPLHIIPDSLVDRQTYLSLQSHLRTSPLTDATRYLPTYASFSALNKPDAALTLKTQFASMVQRVNGVGAEKAVQFLARWDTPGRFFEEAKKFEREVEEENLRLDEEGGKAAKGKRRKVEDFVVEELGDGGTRGIKGKVGARIWDVFMTKGRYPAA